VELADGGCYPEAEVPFFEKVARANKREPKKNSGEQRQKGPFCWGRLPDDQGEKKRGQHRNCTGDYEYNRRRSRAAPARLLERNVLIEKGVTAQRGGPEIIVTNLTTGIALGYRRDRWPSKSMCEQQGGARQRNDFVIKKSSACASRGKGQPLRLPSVFENRSQKSAFLGEKKRGKNTRSRH